MLTITLNLPREVEKRLENDLKHLENITKKSRDFHIKNAVLRYLEHADKLIRTYQIEQEKGNKDYTTEELLEHLNLKEVDWEK